MKNEVYNEIYEDDGLTAIMECALDWIIGQKDNDRYLENLYQMYMEADSCSREEELWLKDILRRYKWSYLDDIPAESPIPKDAPVSSVIEWAKNVDYANDFYNQYIDSEDGSELQRYAFSVLYWMYDIKGTEDPKDDSIVEHPRHYTSGPKHTECGKIIECIDVSETFPSNLGQTIQYIWRAGKKGDALEDLRKASWFLTREIQRLSKED